MKRTQDGGALPPVRSRSAAPLLLLVAIIALGLTTLSGVGYLMWPGWPQPAPEEDAPALPVHVAGVAFNVPPAAIRFPPQRRSGAQPRLDLAYQWPALTPPDRASRPLLTGQVGPQPLVFLSIAEPQEKLSPGERLRNIYPRFLAASAFVGPEGLTGIRFRDGTPYQGEDLMFDPDRPEAFITRCGRDAPAMPATCLLERRIGPAEVTIRFPRLWLQDWLALDRDLERLLDRLRAPA